jgi:hypothetical protein
VLAVWALLSVPATAVATITFERLWTLYDGTCHVGSVQQTADGGYIIAADQGYPGVTPRPPLYAIGLVKVDSLGELEWYRWYPGPPPYTGSIGSVGCVLRSGDYAVMGVCGGPGIEDLRVVRADSVGDSVWMFTYSGPGYDNEGGIAPTADGGVILAALLTTATDAGGGLLKLSGSGEVEWSRIYQPPGHYTSVCGVFQTDDRGYIGHGCIVPDTVDFDSAYTVRTDSVGDTLWTMRYAPTPCEGYGVRWPSLCPVPGGGFAISGWTRGHDSSGSYLAQFDAEGRLVWDKVMLEETSTGAEVLVRSVQALPDGGFILSGDQWLANQYAPHVILLRLGPDHESLWCRKYYGLDTLAADFGLCVIAARDGGFAVAGVGDWDQTGMKRVYLIKTDSAGLVYSGVAEPGPAPTEPRVAIGPNPFTDRMSIRYSLRAPGSVRIYAVDAAGRVVARLLDAAAAAGAGEVMWQPKNVAGGVYFIRVETPDGNATRRALLVRRPGPGR